MRSALPWAVTVLAAFGMFSNRAVAQSETGLNESLLRVASQQSLFYSAWNHDYECDPASGNHAEQLYAEPEVRAFFDRLIEGGGRILPQVMDDASDLQRRAMQRVGPQLLNTLFRGTGCLYLSDVELGDMSGPPLIKGAAWLKLDGDVSRAAGDLATLLQFAGAQMQPVEIASHAFQQIQYADAAAPQVFVGAVGEFLVVGTSSEELAESIGRMSSAQPPQWLSDAIAYHGAHRVTAVGFVNVARIREQFLPLAGPEASEMVAALGLDRIEAIESSTGFTEKEIMSRISVRLNGDATGLLALAGDAGVSPDVLARFPEDALFAAAVSFDPKKALRLVDELTQHFGPNGAQDMAQFLMEFQRNTGVDLEADLIESLGSTWTVHNAAADGLISGLTLSVNVENESRLNGALDRLVDMARQQSEFALDAPRFIRQKFGDSSGYSIQFQGMPIPIEPTWCVADGRLVFTLFPSTMSSALGRVEFRSLLDKPSLGLDAWQTESADSARRLIGFSYTDTQRQFELMYPYAQILLTMGQSMIGASGEFAGPEEALLSDFLRRIQLPPARVIHRHLTPTRSLVWQHAHGIDFESHMTAPGPDLAVAAPLAVGLLLPAVQQVRQAARRTASSNNMRQITLAAHNFHDANRAFPAAGSVGENGQQLLSWRVHLLPYLEHQQLYDQFHLDEPWDSEHNLRLLDQMPILYRSPLSQAEPGFTVYRGIGGPHGALAARSTPGVTGQQLSHIYDGTSQTIMIVEVGDALAVPWTQPDEGLLPDQLDLWGIFSNNPNGTTFAFCDGSIHFFSSSIDESILKFLMMKDDGNFIPWDEIE